MKAPAKVHANYENVIPSPPLPDKNEREQLDLDKLTPYKILPKPVKPVAPEGTDSKIQGNEFTVYRSDVAEYNHLAFLYNNQQKAIQFLNTTGQIRPRATAQDILLALEELVSNQSISPTPTVESPYHTPRFKRDPDGFGGAQLASP